MSQSQPTVDQLLALMAAMQRGRKRLAWFLMPPGIVLLAAGLVVKMSGGEDAALALMVVGGLVALMGLAGVIGVVRSNGPIASVTRALRERGEELVWVYGFQQLVNGRPSRSSIIFRTKDRKQLDLDMTSLAPFTKEDIFAFARAINPSVLIGHDDENEKQYKALSA